VTDTQSMNEKLRDAALEYHRLPTPGKLSIAPTKGLTNQLDLSLAYSPGVAYASLAIADNPAEAATLTSRSNLVGVIAMALGRCAACAGSSGKRTGTAP
jgi:malate dehydrogenase (oxaloacetate-decarboxylating)(NADP+)